MDMTQVTICTDLAEQGSSSRESPHTNLAIDGGGMGDQGSIDFKGLNEVLVGGCSGGKICRNKGGGTPAGRLLLSVLSSVLRELYSVEVGVAAAPWS